MNILLEIQCVKRSFWEHISQDLSDSLDYFPAEKLYSAVSKRNQILEQYVLCLSVGLETSLQTWMRSCAQLEREPALTSNSPTMIEEAKHLDSGRRSFLLARGLLLTSVGLRNRMKGSALRGNAIDTPSDRRTTGMSSSYEGASGALPSTALTTTEESPSEVTVPSGRASAASVGATKDIVKLFRFGSRRFYLRVQIRKYLDRIHGWSPS